MSSEQPWPPPTIIERGSTRIEIRSVSVSPRTAEHGTASLGRDGGMTITPLDQLPGYDPDAELVLVSRAGRLMWVPTETCQ